jgi:putative ABC transport system permease protein
VEGNWPAADDADGCVVGSQLAQALGLKIGQKLPIQTKTGFREFKIRGILESGGIEDQEALAPLESVQEMAGLRGKVRRVEVSAVTKPEDALARIPPARMTPDQFERWSCSNYASTVAYQIQQAIPGSSARPVYRVSETEGKILNRVGLLISLLAAAALITAALAVSSMMLANVLERRSEIGLFRALGAADARVATIFLTEASLVGLAGGALGYLLGSMLAEKLARAIFGSPIGIHWVLLPAALALALAVTLIGSALPLRRGFKMSTAMALRGE